MTNDERINAISINPHMATIDDIAEMAATVQEQRERIAELEAAAAKKNDYKWWESKSEYPFFCMECMEPCDKDVCDTCGDECRGLINENEDTENLERWLDMKGWHPATEPPENIKGASRLVEAQESNGRVGTDYYDYRLSRWKYGHEKVIRWRDLPPMPEVKL